MAHVAGIGVVFGQRTQLWWLSSALCLGTSIPRPLPLAAVSYFPLVTALGKPVPLGVPPWVGAVSWTVGPAFLACALVVWSWGVRHYTSTGS